MLSTVAICSQLQYSNKLVGDLGIAYSQTTHTPTVVVAVSAMASWHRPYCWCCKSQRIPSYDSIARVVRPRNRRMVAIVLRHVYSGSPFTGRAAPLPNGGAEGCTRAMHGRSRWWGVWVALLLIVSVIWPSTTHPFPDGAPFLLQMRKPPNVMG